MMEMDKFNADWWNLKEFKEQFELGNVNLKPDYQRSRVWSDDQRYALIDSLSQGFPIGLVMLNVLQHIEDDVAVKQYDVVDGQQRIRTILEYLLGTEPWSKSSAKKDFTPFGKLKPLLQQKYYSYKIPVALMTKFEDEEINDIFSRLQEGKALKPGEKLKALTTSPVYEPVRDLTKHKVFELGDGRHQTRDSHWMLAAGFFKAAYTGDLFGRIEYANLHKFMKGSSLDRRKGQRTLEKIRKVLNLQVRVLEEAIALWPDFAKYVQTARTLKWAYIVLTMLTDNYAISGKEASIAEGFVEYYKAIAVERSPEWTEYLNTGRTGRVDTEAVKACIAELADRILNCSRADPLDPRRSFTAEQRTEILRLSEGKCAQCGTKITANNFHADHTKAHSRGGRTELGNGRALCSACNRTLGNRWRDDFRVSPRSQLEARIVASAT
jgi:hypothetical protein